MSKRRYGCKSFPVKPRSNALTPRQKAICDLVMEGCSNKQIGRALGISYRTVETYREEIYRNMDVKNGSQLVRKIFEGRIAELTAAQSISA